MGDIYTSLRQLFSIEGIYDNDPDDPGGETVYGIARKKWPSLPLWERVDRIKIARMDKYAIAERIKEDSFLMEEIAAFYKREFWDIFSCDLIPQMVAFEIFEQAVNIGITQCTRHIQRAVNILNRNQESWKDIAEDGKFGKGTLDALYSATKKDSEYLLGLLNILQGSFYINLKNEKFIRGWIKRAQWIYKS